MEYYLTRLKLYISKEIGDIEVKQLVKASTKEKARTAVYKSAVNDGYDDNQIMEIKVYDTLFGE